MMQQQNWNGNQFGLAAPAFTPNGQQMADGNYKGFKGGKTTASRGKGKAKIPTGVEHRGKDGTTQKTSRRKTQTPKIGLRAWIAPSLVRAPKPTTHFSTPT